MFSNKKDNQPKREFDVEDPILILPLIIKEVNESVRGKKKIKVTKKTKFTVNIDGKKYIM